MPFFLSGSILLNLANLEGEESFDVSSLGEAEAVSQEFVGEDEMIIIRGTHSLTPLSSLSLSLSLSLCTSLIVEIFNAPSLGTKNASSATILLRGANHMMLDEMERSVHDALSAVKRVLTTCVAHLPLFLKEPTSYLDPHPIGARIR
jgi:T-complex protein 1 subunit alpha